jgi:hypothetical protein
MTDTPPSSPYPGRPPTGPGPGPDPHRPEPAPWGQAPGGGDRGRPVPDEPGYRPPAWGQAADASPWAPGPGPAPGRPSWNPVPTGPPASAGYDRASIARSAIVLSVAGLFCCGVPSVIGMFMARSEIDAINKGRTDPAHRPRAEAAFAIGLLGTALALVTVSLWAYIRFGAVG